VSDQYTSRDAYSAELYPKSGGQDTINEGQIVLPFAWSKNSEKTLVKVYTKDGYQLDLMRGVSTLTELGRADTLYVYDDSADEYKQLLAKTLETLLKDKLYDETDLCYVGPSSNYDTDAGAVMPLDRQGKVGSKYTVDTTDNCIQIMEDGEYLLHYHMTTYINDSSGDRTDSEAWIELSTDGGTTWNQIEGTYGGMYNRTNGYDQTNASVLHYASLNNGDLLRVYSERESGSASIAVISESAGFLIMPAKGVKGDSPDHQWIGTSLQFENPDGTWGNEVDLKGAPGEAGIAPTWDSGTAYSQDAVVIHNGVMYISLVDSNTEEPGTGSNWDVYDTYQHILDEIFPIGATYWQLPGKEDPSTLGYPGTWENISTEFAGDFFRVEGGDASSFGSGEQLDQFQGHWHSRQSHKRNCDSARYNYIADSGGYHGPDDIVREPIEDNEGNGPPRYGNETRPVNQTIRIWERIS
jgi:hypothetical protein